MAESTKDPDPALVKKAQAGDVEAQYKLSRFYLPDNKAVSEEGMKWLTKAAENGHADAQWRLMWTYDSGWFGVQPDNEQYLYWLTKLADNNDTGNYAFEITNAQYDLGKLYYKGERGVRKDISEYIRWMKKAVFNGSNLAAFSLGLYYQGEGDKQEAIYWLKKAMDIKWAKRKEEDEDAFEALRKLGVTYHPADHVASADSSTPSSTSNTSTANTGSKEPIASGTYTISQQGQSVTSGGFTGVAGPDMVVTIEFFDDGITIDGIWCKYIGESNGKKQYQDPFSFGGSTTTYYVDNNYNVQKQSAFTGPYGTDWVNYTVVKGSVTIPKATPYQAPVHHDDGHNHSGGSAGHNNSGHYVKACHLCHGTGKCPTCNGTHRYLNPLTNKYIICPNCKPDGACPVCGGTGKSR